MEHWLIKDNQLAVILSGRDALRPDPSFLTCDCGRSSRYYAGFPGSNEKFTCIYCFIGAGDREDGCQEAVIYWGPLAKATTHLALVGRATMDYLMYKIKPSF